MKTGEGKWSERCWEGRKQGGKDVGSKRESGVYIGEWQIVFMCLRLRLFISLLPSTPLLIVEEEEEERDEEEAEIFLMSSVILNSLFSIFMMLQSFFWAWTRREEQKIAPRKKSFTHQRVWLDKQMVMQRKVQLLWTYCPSKQMKIWRTLDHLSVLWPTHTNLHQHTLMLFMSSV